MNSHRRSATIGTRPWCRELDRLPELAADLVRLGVETIVR
jgi:hypothetical protein